MRVRTVSVDDFRIGSIWSEGSIEPSVFLCKTMEWNTNDMDEADGR